MHLEEEMFCQGDEEARLGFPISPNFDRSRDSVASTQTFFMEAFIRPLLEPFSTFVKKEWSEQALQNVDSNKDRWQGGVDKWLKADDEEKFGPPHVPKLLD